MATTKQITTSFKNSVKRGTPVTEAFQTVAKRWKTTPTRVANVVTKQGFVKSYKFHGFTYYWPTFQTNNNANWTKQSQYQFVQWAINWAFANGWANPDDFTGMNPWQIWNFLQPKFNTFFKPYKKSFKKNTRTGRTTARKTRTTTRKSTPKTKTRKNTRTGLKYKGRTYKNAKTRKNTTTKTRRYRKAA